MPRRGLGRGLDALIPVETRAAAMAEVVHQIPVEAITPNPHQPRARIDDAALEELRLSIQEHGIIQPLVVARRPEGGYTLIAGERRWRAARRAGLTTVPAVVKEAAPQEMLVLALVENVQRADLNALEEAQAYAQLAETFHLSQGEIARLVGKSRVAVTNKLRLLQAAPAVQQALLEGKISEGHARALLGLRTAALQEAALAVVLREGLTVRQTEELVRSRQAQQTATGAGRRAANGARAPEVRALEERLEASLGTRVSLKPGRRGGRIIIYYYSDEELEALYERLMGRHPG